MLQKEVVVVKKKDKLRDLAKLFRDMDRWVSSPNWLTTLCIPWSILAAPGRTLNIEGLSGVQL